MNYLGETLQVSQALNLINNTLEATLPAIMVEGEVSSFKVSKGKWVFFDLKDEDSILNCFMVLYQLKVPLEDGMKVKVVARPRLTKWGRFSLNIEQLQPVGEGSIKKAYQLLKTKLEKQGLFDVDRKQSIPVMPQNIAVITSSSAAGYQDFKKIINDRWAGLNILQADVQVQGLPSPGQIIKAIQYFNHQPKLADVLVIIRGGGSIDDLAGFNDEGLVQVIAASKIPVIVGVGHENDETLATLVADVGAATPTHAATLLTPDKADLVKMIDHDLNTISQSITAVFKDIQQVITDCSSAAKHYFTTLQDSINQSIKHLKAYDPNLILKRGYSLLKTESGQTINGHKLQPNDVIIIETAQQLIGAKVDAITKK